MQRVRIFSRGAGCFQMVVVFYSGEVSFVVPGNWNGDGSPPSLAVELDGAILPLMNHKPVLADPIYLAPHTVLGFRVDPISLKSLSGKHSLQVVYRGTGQGVKSPSRLESNSIEVECASTS